MEKYNAKVMLDDAHATGVIGDKGRGTCSYYNIEGQVDIVMGTLSKALGGVGGFVASSKEVINYLRHFARSALLSATIPPSVAASVFAAIDVMQSEPERIQTLWKNINYMKDNLISLGYNILESHSSLISILIGEDLLVKKISKRIFEEGIYFSLFVYPAVPEGQERIRLSLMSTHTKKDLDDALCIFEKVGREFDVLNKPINQKLNSDIAA